MIKYEFIEKLETPSLVGKKDISALQSIVYAYPYFQSARLLLTKAYHEAQHLNFEDSLKKTAAYAADRKELHELLFTTIIRDNLQADKKPEKEETEPEGLDLPESTDITPDYSTDNVVADQPELPEASEPVSPIIPVNVENILNDSTEATLPTEEIHPHEEKDILQADLQEGQQEEQPDDSEETDFLSDLKKSTEDQSEHSLLDQQILSSAINSSAILSVSEEIPQLEDLQGNLVEVKSKPDSNFDEEKPHSFSAWLSHLRDESSENELSEDENADSEHFSSDEEEVGLIKKSEFYSASKMARLSVQEDDDLVTETLANIYADQGNFEKALKAFEKLQLKYPEKKVYFAARIKEIRNQLNT